MFKLINFIFSANIHSFEFNVPDIQYSKKLEKLRNAQKYLLNIQQVSRLVTCKQVCYDWILEEDQCSLWQIGHSRLYAKSTELLLNLCFAFNVKSQEAPLYNAL